MRSKLVPILLNSVPGWVRSAYPGVWPTLSLAAHFDTGNYWAQGLGQVSADILFACTRASTKYVANGAGVLLPIASGLLPIADGAGNLVEQAATNLALQSTFNGTWTAPAATLTANAVTSPDGTANAATLVENSASAQHYALQTFTKAASSLAYTGSVYAKPIGGRLIAVQLDDGTNGVTLFFNTTTGAVGSSVPFGAGFAQTSGTITAASGGFYRCSLSVTSTTSTTIRMVVLLASSDGTTNYLGNGTGGASLYGDQLEQNAFATSYIPTTTVAVTRAADSIQPIGAALTAFQSATGWARVATPLGINNAGTAYVLTREQTNANDVIVQSGSTTTFRSFVNGAGVASATIGGAGTWASSVRAATTWDASGIANVANGGTVATGATPFSAGPSNDPYIGSRNGSTASTFISNYISRITFGNTKLSNAALQALAA